MKVFRLQNDLLAKVDFERMGWQWTEASLGSHRFLRARVTLRLVLQAEAILRLPKDWAFFWKNKEQNSWQAAWGMTQALSLDELLTEELDPAISVFGGFPFAASTSPESEWHEFSAEKWFVPKFLWRQSGEDAELEVFHLARAASNDDAWQRKVIAEAWVFMQQLQQASAVSCSSLPAYVQRQDFPGRARWQNMIENAQQSMSDMRFAKVVLSRRASLNFHQDVPAADLLHSLLSLQEESFVFACQSPSGRCFMGRSPERLLAWNGAQFQLDAIAGTRGRSSSFPGDQAFADDLQQSPKEQNEHQLVGRAITNMLRLEGIPFEQIDEQQIIRLQHVQHMRSRFKGEMPQGRRSAELLPLLHPTPAVGGYPLAPSLDFLLREEGYQRGWFSGGIGVFQGSQGDIAIGIRSALLDGSKLYIYAGAGIVPGSLADAEWQEIEVKMQNFLGFLQAESAHHE